MFIYVFYFPSDKDVVTLSVGQLAGLIIGLVLFAMLAVVVAIFVTRKKYAGSFSSTIGAVKFQEEVINLYFYANCDIFFFVYIITRNAFRMDGGRFVEWHLDQYRHLFANVFSVYLKSRKCQGSFVL